MSTGFTQLIVTVTNVIGPFLQRQAELPIRRVSQHLAARKSMLHKKKRSMNGQLFTAPTSTPLHSLGTENRLHPDKMNPDEQQHESMSSPLCQRCKSIDLQDFFSGASAGTDRIFHVFEPPHHLRPSECQLCCAIAFIRPDFSESHVYHLVQVQTNLESIGNHLTIWRPGDSRAQIWTPHTDLDNPSLPGGLGLTSDLHLCENMALNLPGIINFGVLEGWMNYCKKYHGQACELESGASNIPNLRLIDCATKEVRPRQEGDIYAALSYCWGASQASQADETGTPFKLPEHLPATIEDAILATRKLGIKYIWIDRYCVPQGSEDPGRHEQISLMHKIYMGAKVTLIAAAGDSPTYGLPGVTKERRKPPRVHFRSKTLLATFPDPRILIALSRWSTRGWTYQEGLLSRRRLVFTDQQVYFQCSQVLGYPYLENYNYFGYSEAVSLSSGSIKFYNNPKSIGGFFKFQFNPRGIWPQINEYTQRSLGRQEDIMNAMLGIFEKYTETQLSGSIFWHIFGVPILYPHKWAGISWKSSFLDNLAWELPTPSKRREGFPSWSWVGWEGTAFHGGNDSLCPLPNKNGRDNATVYLEQDEGMPAADTDLVIRTGTNTVLHWKIPHIIFECRSVPLHIKNLNQCPSPRHDERYPQLENKLDLRVVMQNGEVLHTYNFQLLPRDLVEDPGLDKGIPCVGLLLDPPKGSNYAQIGIDGQGRMRRGVVVLLVVESYWRIGPEKTGKLYERIGKTIIPNEHLKGISEKRGRFTVG